MGRLFAAAIVTVCVAQAYAQDAQQAPQEQPVQVFACILSDGKTMDDVMALARAYREAWPSFEGLSDESGAFVWTSLREASPYDYVIGFIHGSLTDMASALQSYYASAQAQALDQQFAETGDCGSAIVFSEQIRNGTIGQTADDEPDAVVEVFSCTLKDDATMDDVMAAEENWRSQISQIGSAAIDKYEAYRWTPFRGGTGDADFAWVGNSPDMATWAQGSEDYRGSSQGKSADERINAVSDCSSGLWMGYWIVPPDTGPAAG